MNAHEVMLAKGISHRKTVQVIENSLKPLDITTAEWLCLGAVSSEKLKGNEIASVLGVTKGMASRQLSELQSRGFIIETTAKNDGREKFYTLTSSGRKVLEEANECAKQSLKKWLSPISNEDVRTYIKVLHLVAKM